jgi:predicted metal-binding protein
MLIKAFAKSSRSAESASEVCKCNGTCPGYGTRSNCPPLIIIAAMAMSQAALLHANLVKFIGISIPSNLR